MKKILLILFLLIAPLLCFAETITLESGEQVETLKLPETIQGIKVAGKTICSIDLLQDGINVVKAYFSASAKESLTSLSFQFSQLHKEGPNYSWIEKWIANGPTTTKQYNLEFKFTKEGGTDISVQEDKGQFK